MLTVLDLLELGEAGVLARRFDDFSPFIEHIRTAVRQAQGGILSSCLRATPVMDLDGNAIFTTWLESRLGLKATTSMTPYVDSCICHNLMHTISAIMKISITQCLNVT